VPCLLQRCGRAGHIAAVDAGSASPDTVRFCHGANGADRRESPKTLSNQGCIAGSPAYVHLDLDVLDPVEGRMNEFAAPDGLSPDDLKRCLAQIASSQPIRAASVTAFDPASDTTGRAAMVAMAAILALVAAAAASARSYT
jgi:Arginase family